MRQRRWTARTSLKIGTGKFVLAAQAKSSRAELVKRLLADDPCWHREMSLSLEKAWAKKHFRRGLAIRANG